MRENLDLRMLRLLEIGILRQAVRGVNDILQRRAIGVALLQDLVKRVPIANDGVDSSIVDGLDDAGNTESSVRRSDDDGLRKGALQSHLPFQTRVLVDQNGPPLGVLGFQIAFQRIAGSERIHSHFFQTYFSQIFAIFEEKFTIFGASKLNFEAILTFLA